MQVLTDPLGTVEGVFDWVKGIPELPEQLLALQEELSRLEGEAYQERLSEVVTEAVLFLVPSPTRMARAQLLHGIKKARGLQKLKRALERAAQAENVIQKGAGAAGAASTTARDVVIQGVAKHLSHQAITRGFKTSDILKIIREGKAVQAMGRYGAQTRYTLRGNTVVINAKGEIITVFSRASGTAKGLGRGVSTLKK